MSDLLDAPPARARAAPLPQPAPEPAPIVPPRDTPYPGRLTLSIDATDTARGVIAARLAVPVARPGPMTLLYPKWMPGYHSPQNPIELLAGLRIRSEGVELAWRRDPVEVYAFHVDVPRGASVLEIEFQFLSPTTSVQGDVVVTPDLSCLQWGRMLLYPAGYFARRIEVAASVKLPEGWSFASALEHDRDDRGVVAFKPTPLDDLVDSPLFAGPHLREIALDEGADVRMALFAHDPAKLAASDEQLDLHRALIEQADRLFASRHFDRYRFLVALSDELGGGGVEHHRSTEIILPPSHFTEWDRHLPGRDVVAHEFVHSWNGKFRRGADSWTPSFEQPIRNSLMWVYEGQTQYWGQVLTARSGLWGADMAIHALAKVAAVYDVRPGSLWRPMSDTTRDPIIAAREPLPWPSWQRSEDYYSEGQLLWLAVDTLIRERSGDRRSLDDFARAFFGMEDGRRTTLTYDFDEIVHTLERIAEHDWRKLFEHALEDSSDGELLNGLARGGYRLVYRERRNPFCEAYDRLHGQYDMRFSIGLIVGDEGAVQEVMWAGPAFRAGLTAGAQIETVGGEDYSHSALEAAIDHARNGEPIELTVSTRGRRREVAVAYSGGHRFPYLEPIPGARRRLDEILRPL